MKRKIGIITGSRAEYGYLKPLIKRVGNSSELKLLLYVTGMHLLKECGDTIQEIKRDGFRITKIIGMDTKISNTNYDLALSIGRGITAFADVFQKSHPDLMVVFGDRIEPFAATIAAVAMNIPVAHISGGEVGLGDIDDNLRHAITKLAHLHFVSSSQSKERILKLGEESWRVFKVGALSLDTILNKKLLTKKELCTKYGIPNKALMLISYHPVTTEWLEARNQIETVMDSVITIASKENMEIIVIYPNTYPGGRRIINTIKKLARQNKNIYLFKNLSHLAYISLMANSSVLVGNTSSGIIEAPSLGTPYICIGTRQQGRERANNVIDVGYSKNEIIAGIQRALLDKDFLKIIKKCKTPYGNGKAAQKILYILKKVKINKSLLQKRITY